MGDFLIYFLIPIVLCSTVSANTQVFSTLIISMLGIGYTLLIRYNQYRVNVTGVIFMSLYTFIQSLNVGAGGPYYIYAYNTYYMVGATIIFIIAMMFNKNVVKQLCIDILKALNYTSMHINNIIKKHNLKDDFDKLSYIIIIHLLILALIRISSIVNLGAKGYRGYLNAEVLLTTLFIILEIVCISSFITKFKLIMKKGKTKVYKQVNLDSKSNIINFNQYKNFNK